MEGVAGVLMPPHNVRVLIPGTCECHYMEKGSKVADGIKLLMS